MRWDELSPAGSSGFSSPEEPHEYSSFKPKIKSGRQVPGGEAIIAAGGMR